MDNQPETPQFERDPGIGMYPPPEPGTTDLKEPGMFCSNDGLIINWMGENFYKSCPETVVNYGVGGSSGCTKRVGHPGDHEDYAGHTKPRKEVIDFSNMSITNAVGQAIGAASMCWESVENAGEFDSTRAALIFEALMDRIRESGTVDGV